MAVVLLVVGVEVLHGGDDALALHAADVSGGGLAGEVRVFAEVLEVAAAHGSAVDIDAGAEDEVDAAGASVVGNRDAHLMGELRIPGGGQGDAAGVGGVRSPGANAVRAVAHLEAGKSRSGLGANEHAVHAADDFQLLLQGELRDHGVGLLLDGGTIRNRSLSQGRQRERAAEKRRNDVNRLNTHDFLLQTSAQQTRRAGSRL